MPLRLSCLRPLALALALIAGSAARAGESSFDFYIAGIRVGALTLGTAESGGGYSAAGRIDTAGIAGLFGFFFDGEAAGNLGRDGTVVPVRYTATSKSPRALRHTVIDWQNGTPVRVSVEPPRSSAPDPAQQSGTLDPVSASFLLLRDAPVDTICDTTLDVFDGSRRSRLTLAPPVEADGGLACSGTYARLEGEGHTLARRREFPFRIVFRRAGDLAQLQRIEAPTSFGNAVIERRG
jgi:Protein of unknown function (DUF3108)